MGKLSEEEEKFAYNYLSDREAYHHHKEQMAYIGFLVQTAFFTAIMTFNWNSSSPETTNVCPELILALAVPFWVLIHVFLRWQLRLRRYAALHIATLTNALLKNLKGSVVEITGNVPPQENATIRSKSRWWRSLADWSVWPLRSAFPAADIDISEYPDWYQNEFKSQVAKGTGAVFGERLVSSGSWLILIGIFVRLTVLS